MKTAAERKADERKRRVTAGEREITVWLDTSARETLDRLAGHYGSRAGAIIAGLELAKKRLKKVGKSIDL